MTDDLLELDTIAEKFFGINPKLARRKAALGKLPVVAFRLGNTQKGPLFVRKSDVDALVAARSEKAKQAHLAALTGESK